MLMRALLDMDSDPGFTDKEYEVPERVKERRAMGLGGIALTHTLGCLVPKPESVLVPQSRKLQGP